MAGGLQLSDEREPGATVTETVFAPEQDAITSGDAPRFETIAPPVTRAPYPPG